MQYSQDQELALKKMHEWYKACKEGLLTKQVFYLTGWAGTGKTTIANAFADEYKNKGINKDRIAYGSFTGKAALRMRQAGMQGAQTLHSMIYTVETDRKTGKPVFHLDPNSSLRKEDLLILDECSMVDKELGEDVLSFKVPVLVLGDPGQLPPIKGTGFFTSRKPDATLSEVHRQALENPIIKLATDIREGKPIQRMNEPNLKTYIKSNKFDAIYKDFDQILCGTNKTRNRINDLVRAYEGYDDLDVPHQGERIICLRNNRVDGVFNGLIGTMTKGADPNADLPLLEFVDEEETIHMVYAHREGFIDDKLFNDMHYSLRKSANEFTWGYCVTVHKSQGSQWDSVLLADDNFLIWDKPQRRKWIYTAVTRAADKLGIMLAKGL